MWIRFRRVPRSNATGKHSPLFQSLSWVDGMGPTSDLAPRLGNLKNVLPSCECECGDSVWGIVASPGGDRLLSAGATAFRFRASRLVSWVRSMEAPAAPCRAPRGG